MANVVQQPYSVFTDDDGKPLDGGYIYIGAVGPDPISSPVAVYWDEALTIPASQPLRTKFGYIYRNGTPANVYTASVYSIVAKDANQVTIYTATSAGAGIVLGSMALLNAGTAGAEFRTNAQNDARFLLASAYSPGSAVSSGQPKIINGDFGVNQVGAISPRTLGIYPLLNGLANGSSDRWAAVGTSTKIAATMTANSAAIGHLLPKDTLTVQTSSMSTSADLAYLIQRIESARSYAGQTFTLFQWLKRATAGNIAVSIRQHFGTGGSPSADVTTYIGQLTLTASFSPYRMAVAVPSVSGKTFGTNNDDYLEIVYWISAGSTYNSTTGSLGLFNTTVDFSGIHDRPGDVPIEAINYYQPPDSQVETARCQRYFARLENCGQVSSGTVATGQMVFPVKMRAVPTFIPTYTTGTGAAWVVSTTGAYQNTFHSAAARVTQVDLNAEL